MSLLSIHSDNGERIGKSEDISFRKSIGGNNCSDTMIRLTDGKYTARGGLTSYSNLVVATA
jgi:hypothetical protein